MLFHVTMLVSVPHGIDPTRFDELKKAEKARCQELMAAGTWRHIWRVVGHYKNVSIFDVTGPSELHDLLTSLPLFPFMEITVTPLCRHPSSFSDDDR
jgi:muconolactone D-isomerase